MPTITVDTGSVYDACVDAYTFGREPPPEFIEAISKEPYFAWSWAGKIGERFIMGEPAIYSDDFYALNYAHRILKSKLPDPIHNRCILRAGDNIAMKPYLDMLKNNGSY
jgi:hypothetical protein